MAENHTMGVYNACGPEKQLTMSEMLYGIKAVTTAGAQFTWVPADFLREQKIRAWRDMRTWIPPEGEQIGFSSWSNAKAVAKGLTFRPLAVTAKDTLGVAQDAARGGAQGNGRRRSRRYFGCERGAVLAAWKAKQKTAP
jgi:2'-hydroxyisoflavone reductase